MATLYQLKRSIAITMALVIGLFLFFIIVIDYVLSFVIGSTISAIYILIIIAIFVCLFILLQWLIAPWIVKHAVRLSEKNYIAGMSNVFLVNTIKELCVQSNIPMPRIAVVYEESPNAFVFGRTLHSSTLVVHSSLLEKLNKDEIRSVLAHEIGHLKHKDVIVMTLISAIPLLTYIVARVFFQWLRHPRSSGSGKGKAQAFIIAAIVAAISYTIYFISQLLVLHLSRTREYYADSYSSYITKNPKGLVSALTKITYGLSFFRDEPQGARAFYAIDPVKANIDYSLLTAKMHEYDIDKNGTLDEKELAIAVEKEKRSPWAKANELFSTHPHVYKRILVLLEIDKEMKLSGFPKNIYKFV